MFALLAGIVAAGAAIIGGALSAKATAEASKAQQEMAEANKTQAEKEAEQIAQATEFQISDLKTQQARFRGHQKAVIGRSGVELSSGSPLALQAETARMMSEDVRRLSLAGKWEKEARLFEASQYGEEAEAYKKTRPWQVAGSLLSGVASGAGMFI